MQRSKKISRLDPLADILKRISGNFVAKFGNDRIKLINDWETIIGLEFAKCSYPYKIVKLNENNSLTIIVNNSSAATMISFTQGLLIEKINAYFGYKMIDKIRIIIK